MILEFVSPSARMRSSIWRSSFSWANAPSENRTTRRAIANGAEGRDSSHGSLLSNGSCRTIRRRRRPCQKTARRSPRRFPIPADLLYNEGTMRAAFLTGVRSIEVRETPAPRIARDDDVLVRSKAVGVCGSDLHYYLSDSVGADKVKYPFIPGHECAGVVTEVGRGSPGSSPGTRSSSNRPSPAATATSAGRAGPTPAASSSSSATTASSPAAWPSSPWPPNATASPCRRG